MPSLDDPEGTQVPSGLPPVVDAHVHIFPQTIFAAVRKWFAQHAWRTRYPLSSAQALAFLLSRGIEHVVALQYAHKPGMARQLNHYMLDQCRRFKSRVTGMATVFPGEENAEQILQEAFDLGLGGLKLHAHVQCFDIAAKSMQMLLDCCRKNRKPVIMHIGRQPKSKAYRCDPYQLCSADKLENTLRNFPDLKICVPHLGFDETTAYRKLVEKYDNLWLDTTMVITDYFQLEGRILLGRYRPDRVMYGSDFPNIPYAWDRELKALRVADISHDALERIAGRNASEFYGIHLR